MDLNTVGKLIPAVSQIYINVLTSINYFAINILNHWWCLSHILSGNE